MMYSPSPHTTMKRPVCVMGGGVVSCHTDPIRHTHLYRPTPHHQINPIHPHPPTDQPHTITSIHPSQHPPPPYRTVAVMRHALGEDLARAQVAGDDGQALPVPHSSRGAGGGGRLVLPPASPLPPPEAMPCGGWGWFWLLS